MFQLLDCITNMKNEDEPVIRTISYYFDNNDYRFPENVDIEVVSAPSFSGMYASTYVATVKVALVNLYRSPRLLSKEEAVAAAKAWLRVILENGRRVLDSE
jgi:hypothetical protein